MPLYAFALFSWLNASPLAASAAPTRDLNETALQIRAYLGSIDTPISPEQWRALGAQAIPQLETIATNLKELPTQRAKAMEGLAAFGSSVDQPTAQFLLRIANDDSQVFTVRRTALYAYGEVAKKEQLLSTVKPLMEHSTDHRLRFQAAQLLVRHAPSDACDSIKVQSTHEKAEVHHRWHQLTRECEAR